VLEISIGGGGGGEGISFEAIDQNKSKLPTTSPKKNQSISRRTERERRESKEKFFFTGNDSIP